VEEDSNRFFEDLEGEARTVVNKIISITFPGDTMRWWRYFGNELAFLEFPTGKNDVTILI
jgi:hypothetical protein